MANIQTIRLTEPQYSALECAGALEGHDGQQTTDEDILRLSLQGSGAKAALVVSVNTQEPIWRALNELSNGEDFIAQQRKGDEVGRLAGRASRSLAAVASKVLLLTFKTETSPKGDSDESTDDSPER